MRVTVLKNAQLALCVRGWHTSHCDPRRVGDALPKIKLSTSSFPGVDLKGTSLVPVWGRILPRSRDAQRATAKSGLGDGLQSQVMLFLPGRGLVPPPGQRSGWSGLSFEVDSLIRNGLPSV
jgi:hypothetical protein